MRILTKKKCDVNICGKETLTQNKIKDENGCQEIRTKKFKQKLIYIYQHPKNFVCF